MKIALIVIAVVILAVWGYKIVRDVMAMADDEPWNGTDE